MAANCIGFPLARAMVSRKSSEQKKEAWRMSHSANSGFGVFFNIPHFLKKSVENGAIWNVRKGWMLFIFVVDGALMVLNLGLATI